MVYFYDGTKEAFLTAFLIAYPDEEAVLCSGEKQLALGQKTVFVCADRERARRAEMRLREIDKDCLAELDLLLRSGQEGRDAVAFEYLRLIAARGRPMRKMYAEDAVSAAEECVRRVQFEVERCHGFLRFLECACGALYAPFSPVNDICDLLVPYFRTRLGQFPFVIHDIKRAKAAVFDGEHVFLAPLQSAELALRADEAAWLELWKKYCKSVRLPPHEQLERMRGYMPVRYWRVMPEKKSG